MGIEPKSEVWEAIECPLPFPRHRDLQELGV